MITLIGSARWVAQKASYALAAQMHSATRWNRFSDAGNKSRRFESKTLNQKSPASLPGFFLCV
jgi:hypothetical protein